MHGIKKTEHVITRIEAARNLYLCLRFYDRIVELRNSLFWNNSFVARLQTGRLSAQVCHSVEIVGTGGWCAVRERCVPFHQASSHFRERFTTLCP